jgi:hypothetical protein
MTKVISLPSPRAGAHVHSFALSHKTIMAPVGCVTLRGVDTVARQAAIENALSMALHFVRQPGDSAANLWAATARANRALTLLKHASGGTVATGGRV